MNKNLYEILGLDKNATQEDIEKAYIKKVKELHPDTNSSPEAEKEFSLVNEAYRTLSDINSRSNYDNSFSTEYDLQSGNYNNTSNFSNYSYNNNNKFTSDFNSTRWDMDTNWTETFKETFFHFYSEFNTDTFNSEENLNKEIQNADIDFTMKLNFYETCYGFSKFINYESYVKCRSCMMGCDACSTDKRIGKRGFIKENNRVLITLSKRIPKNGVYTLKHKGNQYMYHQDIYAGNLNVYFEVQEKKPNFELIGYDVIQNVFVTLREFLTNRRFKIVDHREKSLIVNIPAGLQPGQRIVRLNKGAAYGNNKFGKHIIRFFVLIEPNLSSEEKRFIEENELRFSSQRKDFDPDKEFNENE